MSLDRKFTGWMGGRHWIGFALFGVGVLFASAASAQTNPDGFNTPEGLVLHSSKLKEFALHTDTNGDRYTCIRSTGSSVCNASDFGFSAKGTASAEGRIETATYTAGENKPIPGYLLQKSYESLVTRMGGRLLATKQGEDPGRGYMRHVFFLERAGQKKWIHVDTSSDSRQLILTVVTSAEAPQLVTASQLKSQIESQGFATLHVNFDTSKAIVRSEDTPALDQVLALLDEEPSLKLSIEGHTDNVGSASANKSLSLNRSKAIVDYLVNKGVDRSRLRYQGLGMEIPVADNRSEEGRAKNRRVELVKLK